jgi:hypothetical protein
MKSTAFDNFHLSDLEYGLRNHHDQLRRLLPVLRETTAPAEGSMSLRNEELLRIDGQDG